MKYVLYGSVGDFYYSAYYQRWIRAAWIWTNLAVLTVTVVIGCAGYWLTADHISAPEVTHLLGLAAAICTGLFLVPAITYWKRRELEAVLELPEDERSAAWSAAERRGDPAVAVSLAATSLIFAVSHLTHPWQLLAEQRPPNLFDYLFPVPGAQRLRSTPLFLLVYAVHLACAVVVNASLNIGLPPFFVLLASQLRRACARGCATAGMRSERAVRSLDQLAAAEGEESCTLIRERLELHRATLHRSVLALAGHHRRLLR